MKLAELRYKAKLYLALLWCGVALGVIAAAIVWSFETEATNDNPLLAMVVLLLLVLYGIAGTVLFLEIWDRLRWWVLTIIPVSILSPVLSLVLLHTAMYVCLIYLTCKYVSILRDSRKKPGADHVF